MAGKSLGTLTIDLIARVGGFVAGMDRAERSSDEWSQAVQKNAVAAAKAIAAVASVAQGAAVAVGVAGFQLLKTTSAQISETDKWAKSLKMSTQELLAWQFAAEKAGLAGDNMADIFKDIGDKIGDAVLNKSGDAVDALDSLGLSAEKLSKVSPDKQLLAIGEAIGKIDTNAGKVTILESLGNDLSKMLPLFDNNNEKLKQFLQLSKDYGVAPNPESIDDLVKVNDLFQQMDDQVKGLKIEIASGLAKADLSPLQVSLDKIRDVLTDPGIQQGLVDLVSNIASLAGWLIKTAAAAGELLKFQNDRVSVLGGNVDKNSEDQINGRIEHLQNLIDQRKGFYDQEESMAGWILGEDDSVKALTDEVNELIAARDKLRESKIPVINLPTQAATVGGVFDLGDGESNGKQDKKNVANTNKIENAFKSVEQRYLRQIALIDKVNGKTKETTELQKIQFDINDGKLKGLNEAQKLTLEGLATEIDRLNVLGKFKDLQDELLTPEEKLLGITKERVNLLREAKGLGLVSDDDYQKAAKAIAGASFTAAPHFEGIDPMFGGQSGELRKIEEAQKELETWYQTQLEMLEENRKNQSDLNEQWDAQELALRKKHQDELDGIDQARNQLMLSSIEDGLGSVADITKNALGEQSGLYKAAFVAQKAAAIAQSTIAISQGIAMASANPFPLNLAAMASVAAATAGIISNIQSVSLVGMAHSGMDSVPETGTWLLQKGERVTTAQTSAKLDATLDRVSAQSTGGMNFSPVISVPINGNPSDSTVALVRSAVKEATLAAYNLSAQDLATGTGKMSKAMGSWATGRKVS